MYQTVLQESQRQATMNSYVLQAAFLSVVFLAVSGNLHGCDPDTGPAGVVRCFLDPSYDAQYQYGTCHANSYVRQTSKGKHECRDRTSTYCYYQCMLEKHGLYSGSVYEDCRCDPNGSLPQPSVILPTACYSPDGTDCGWYRQCLAKEFPCTGHAEYAINYGEKFCNLYTNSRLHFSRRALQWINATRKCLQVALVPVLHFGPAKPTCEEIKTIAFESHVPCYVEPHRGLSICNLSLADWVRVFWTIKSSFLPPTFAETLKASVEVLTDCGIVWSTQLSKYGYAVSVQLEERINGQAVGDMLSDDELAHAIVLDISSSLQWSQDSTIDWYAFAVNTSAFMESPTTSSADRRGRELTIQVITAFLRPSMSMCNRRCLLFI